MASYRIENFQRHEGERPWYSAEIVEDGFRAMADNRWGSWTCYAFLPPDATERPEPGRKLSRNRWELCKAVQKDLGKRTRSSSRKAVKAMA